jgi:hypothetical protein
MPSRFTLDKVREAFSNAGCTLLTESYSNQNLLLDFKCACGQNDKVNMKNFTAGHRCDSCNKKRIEDAKSHERQISGIKAYAEKKRHKIIDVIDYYKEHGCELLAYEYANNTEKMPYLCKCGNISSCSFKRFKEGTRCGACFYRKKDISFDIDWTSKAVEYSYAFKTRLIKYFI